MAHGLARAALAALLGGSLGAAAQDVAKDAVAPIRLIVPTPAGGSADRVGRTVAAHLAAILERPVRVDNVFTGGMVGGVNAIAEAPPDGNTLGIGVSTAMIGGRFLVREARFNPTEDFAWLAILGRYPNALIVADREPARTLAQWIAAKRGSPRPIVAGAFGPGSASHLAASYLRVAHGVPIVPRWIDNLADGYRLLSSGEIDVLFDGVPNAVVELPRSGHRAIAVTSARPHAAFPDLPSFGTLGPDVSFDVWIALVAPKSTPAYARATYASAVAVLLVDPRFAASLRAAQLEVLGIGGDAALAFVEDEVLRVARLISRFGESPAPATK